MKIRKIILSPGEQIEIAIEQQDEVPEMFLPSMFVRAKTDSFAIVTVNTITRVSVDSNATKVFPWPAASNIKPFPESIDC